MQTPTIKMKAFLLFAKLHYDGSPPPIHKLFGKSRVLPIEYRWLGPGRIAIDTIKGWSLIVEAWWLR